MVFAFSRHRSSLLVCTVLYAARERLGSLFSRLPLVTVTRLVGVKAARKGARGVLFACWWAANNPRG